MNRARRSRGRLSLLAKASYGSIALGIACMGWASANIWADSAALGRPTTGVGSTTGSATGDFAPKQSGSPSATPVSRKVAGRRPPAEGDSIGTLLIPALDQKLPIVEGTGTDDLKRGVGHFIKSALPGEPDNCVLSGHRDTVFARLGELKKGDRVTVQTAAGSYTYRIKRVRIVGKNDRTVIVHADRAILTLTTCYPFSFVGSAPDRYILSADLVARP